MQVIQITSLTGHSPYDITICDITNTYCYSGVTGATSVPLTIDIPTELSGTTELLVVVTDSIGCQEIQYHICGEPIPSQTPTPTPTITPTNLTCNCISIENPSGVTLNFGYTQCDGLPFYGPIYSATTLYVCGKDPYGDVGLNINISTEICTGNVCLGPTPTPTTTPTPTPTLPPVVGYFQDTCDLSYEFVLTNLPPSFIPTYGIYYIQSSGYVGCAKNIVSTSSTNIFSVISFSEQPNDYHCQKANFLYPCPTLTPTPSVTPTITPTPTNTLTPTPTNTLTPTPTTSVKYNFFKVSNCCDSLEGNKNIKFMSLPNYFLPGTAVVDTNGNCWEILSTSTITPNEFWNNGVTYLDCALCVSTQTCSPTPLSSFISVWVTTSPNESITLPYETTGSYNGTIDWGDGDVSTNSYSNRTHIYSTPGTYTITITGTLIGWSFKVNPTSRLKISEVLQWGCLRLGNSGGYFEFCTNLTLSNVTDVLDLTGTINLSYMFVFCSNLTTIPLINSWDTSNVINMLNMFVECNNFNDDITGWDVSNVIDMSGMFDNTYLFNQPIGSWDTSSVQNMSYMFLQNPVFDQDLSSWDVSNVTNMKGIFNGCSSFNNGGSPMISGWTTSNVTDMGDMFGVTPFNQPIGSWDVSNVIKMDYMFSNTTSFNQPLSGWNVSNVTDMAYMFQQATSFNQDIGMWDVSNVADFTDFMIGKTNLDYSTINLDSIYNGWSSLPTLQSGIIINFGTIKYSAGGSAGKAILQGTYGWTITDGGI